MSETDTQSIRGGKKFTQKRAVRLKHRNKKNENCVYYKKKRYEQDQNHQSIKKSMDSN